MPERDNYMNVEISVIIPVYNSEKYLKRCIESVLKQSYTNFELILVNDGSEDHSGEICEKYREQDKRIKVIHQNNKGQAAARNIGVKLAKGKWVHFVDSDDCIHPQMLEILLNMVKKYSANISMCGTIEAKEIPVDFFEVIDVSSSKYMCELVCEHYLRDIITLGDKLYWIVWGKLIKKEIVEKYPFEENRIYEDNAVVCKWLVEAKTVAIINYPLYFYYVNKLGTTKSAFSEKQLDRLWALEEQIKFYRKINYKEMYKLIIARYLVACASCLNATQDKKVRRRIKYLFYKQTLINFFKIKLSYNEKIHIGEAFYPGMMRYYWKIKK